jgi:hypothetical protein
MRQIVVVEELLRECGIEIFPGLRRFVSVMCFLVVSWSQIATLSSSPSSSPESRFGLDSVLDFSEALMCFKSAFEAFRV